MSVFSIQYQDFSHPLCGVWVRWDEVLGGLGEEGKRDGETWGNVDRLSVTFSFFTLHLHFTGVFRKGAWQGHIRLAIIISVQMVRTPCSLVCVQLQSPKHSHPIY